MIDVIKPKDEREIDFAIYRTKEKIVEIRQLKRHVQETLQSFLQHSKLEQKVLEEESTGQSKAEAIAEEQTWAKPVYTLNDVEYEAIHPAMPHEKFVKGPARYASEVKATVYVKYRSIAQNLRNITLTRGLMSYLEHVTGITVIKKVK